MDEGINGWVDERGTREVEPKFSHFWALQGSDGLSIPSGLHLLTPSLSFQEAVPYESTTDLDVFPDDDPFSQPLGQSIPLVHRLEIH